MSSSVVYLQVEPSLITDVNRIFEACEYLALVSTVDRAQGILKLRATPDTMPEVQEIVEHLPMFVRVLTNFQEV